MGGKVYYLGGTPPKKKGNIDPRESTGKGSRERKHLSYVRLGSDKYRIRI